MPQRFQLRRTAGWRKPAGAVVVARPSKWGNPFHVGAPGDELTCRELFRTALLGGRLDYSMTEVREELAGRDLLCWCVPGTPCHGDVLLEIANRP